MLTARLPPFAESRPAVRRAVEWALVMHADQKREVDQAPFVLHPLEVASLLNGRDFDDDVVKVAKVRELRAKAARDPKALRGRKLDHYRASLEMLRASGHYLALVDQ